MHCTHADSAAHLIFAMEVIDHLVYLAVLLAVLFCGLCFHFCLVFWYGESSARRMRVFVVINTIALGCYLLAWTKYLVYPAAL